MLLFKHIDLNQGDAVDAGGARRDMPPYGMSW